MKRRTFIHTLCALPLGSMVTDLKILGQWIDETPATTRQPVLFIGHGSPMNAIETNPYTKALQAWSTAVSVCRVLLFSDRIIWKSA
jgi:4,5-DOPA dioxygenase extradiol